MPNITSKVKDIAELHRQILTGAMTKTNANFQAELSDLAKRPETSKKSLSLSRISRSEKYDEDYERFLPQIKQK